MEEMKVKVSFPLLVLVHLFCLWYTGILTDRPQSFLSAQSRLSQTGSQTEQHSAPVSFQNKMFCAESGFTAHQSQ